jgi:hypothetical protein
MLVLQWLDSFKYIRQLVFPLADLPLVVALAESLGRQGHQAGYWLEFEPKLAFV